MRRLMVKPMKSKLKRNIWLLYIFSFFWLSMVIISVIVPFFESRGLSLAEVYYLQAIFAFFVVSFEVPSGYIADMLGRKNALVAGSLFHGIGFTWLCYAQGFAELAAVEFFLGVGSSLLSGADLSLLYDSQQALDESVEQRTRGIANIRFIKSIAEGVSALVGGALVAISFDATVGVNAVVAWVPLAISIFLVEAPFTRMESGQHWGNLRKIVSHMLLGDRLLRLVCFGITLFGLMTFLVVWMMQPYWQAQGVPLTTFGLLWAAQSFLFAIATRLCIPLEARFGARPVLVIMAVLPVVGYFGMSAVGGAIGILFGFAFAISRGLNQVLLTDALNRRVPSAFRSTANSLTSFMFRGAYIITGPIVGLMTERLGMQGTLAVLGVAASASFVMLLLPLVKEVRIVERQAAGNLAQAGAAAE